MGKYGFLKALFLETLLEKKELTGYEFMKICKEKGMDVSPGSVYPMIDDLSEKGLITCKREGKRRVCILTSKGEKLAMELRESKKTLKEALKKLGVNFERHDAPEFLKKDLMELFRSLKNVDWKRKKGVDELIDSLVRLLDDLRRWMS